MRRLVSPFSAESTEPVPAEPEEGGRVYAFPGTDEPAPTDSDTDVAPAAPSRVKGVLRLAGDWLRASKTRWKKAISGDTVFAEQLPSIEELFHQYRKATPTDVIPLLLLYRFYGFLLVIPANVLVQTGLWLLRYPARIVTFLLVERVLIVLSPQAKAVFVVLIDWLAFVLTFLLT